jgi:RNA polymerase primary sigma factor
MKHLAKTNLLTKQEEIDLAKRIEKGDDNAKRIMIESNLRLSFSIAKKYARYGSSLEDLVQETNIGLIKAVEKFNWRKGFKFSTYACWWIKQSATRHLTDNSSILKIPSHVVGNSRRVYQAYQDYVTEFKEEPSIEEIAAILDMKVKNVKISLTAIKAKNTISLDRQISDSNSRTIGEIIPDNAVSVEDLLDQKIIRSQIINAFKTLSKREELVLRLRFGIEEVSNNNKDIYMIAEEEV